MKILSLLPMTTAMMLWLVSAGALAACPPLLDHSFRKLHSSEEISLCAAAEARALLVVNTASHCGFTPQFKSLEALHQARSADGLVIVGFPSDDFNQEAASEAETAKVCYVNNGVSFTMTAPIGVRGEGAHPLFAELAERTEAPGWNFNKYLVDPATGEVLHFQSRVAPDDPALLGEIDRLLGASGS